MANSNNSVVAIFRANNGTWGFAHLLGKEMKNEHFGQSIVLNERLLAIASRIGKKKAVLQSTLLPQWLSGKQSV